jgi:hypothetical protein
MIRRVAALVLAALAAAGAPAAAAPPSASVTVTATTLVFTASDMATTALGSAPATASATVTWTTTAGGAGGTVTVTPVTLTSSTGATLVPGDFTLTCKFTSGNNGFVAAPSTKLNGATTCGTLAAGKTAVSSTFAIALTLNDTTAAATPFEAATFTGTFTVTATAS